MFVRIPETLLMWGFHGCGPLGKSWVVGVSDGDTITVLRNGKADSLIPRMPLWKTWTA